VKTKLAALEEENADLMMKRALDLNVDAEVSKRFAIAKRMMVEGESLDRAPPT
jgi:hypothetical protein